MLNLPFADYPYEYLIYRDYPDAIVVYRTLEGWLVFSSRTEFVLWKKHGVIPPKPNNHHFSNFHHV